MTITTVLAGAVMSGVWRWQWPTVAVVLVPIMTVDLALFGANALKIPTGGWLSLVIGLDLAELQCGAALCANAMVQYRRQFTAISIGVVRSISR